MSYNGNGLGSSEYRRSKRGHGDTSFEERIQDSLQSRNETLDALFRRQSRLRGGKRSKKK